MEALRLEPRKRKADPKRKEADADRQAYLKGVTVPCPCDGGTENRNQLE